MRSAASTLRVVLALCLAPWFAACEPDDGYEEPRWEYVFTDLPAALLSVWGQGPNDVWAAGADVGDGPWVLRYDGDSWKRKVTGARGTVWSVFSRTAGRTWLAGEGGLVLRHDRATDAFTPVGGVPTNVTIYGVFEAPSGEIWAVGGNGQGGRVFSMASPNGSTLAEVELPEDSNTGRFYKVWGRSSDELWVVGAAGDVLQRKAGGWEVFDSPRGGRLSAVHGNAGLTIAVGGFANGLVATLHSYGPVDTSPPQVPPLNGVWVDTDGRVVAVGSSGAVIERRGSVWRTPSGLPNSLEDLQAVYIDPTGGVWAVGGALLVEPQRRGVLLRYGPPISSTIQ